MVAQKYEAHQDQLTEVTQEDWDLTHYKLFAMSRVLRCTNVEVLKKIVNELSNINDISMREIQNYKP